MATVPLVEMRGVRKTFGEVVALNGADFLVGKGEICGLLGGNGAGKTTLMNVLYGLYKPDEGEILLRGESVKIASPRDALHLGIGMVHQHFLLIEDFTVTENIVLGTRYHLLSDLSEERKRVTDLAKRFRLEVDPDAIITSLPMGTRQRVEILKALYRGAELLVLDEPTTNLTPQEVDFLFSSLGTMVQEGLSVVFITHKIREVLRVCQRIVVLREGKNVGGLTREDASEQSLVRLMVGQELDVKRSLIFAQGAVTGKPLQREGRPLLTVENLHVMHEREIPAVKGCSFDVYAGEILGIAGVAGNGQRELAEGLMAIRPIAGGEIQFDGLKVSAARTRDLLAHGVSYIPEDRIHDGFLPTANVAENLILGAQRQTAFRKGGFLNWSGIYDMAGKLILNYKIKTPGPMEMAGKLSGGNIQRLMIARAFSQPAKLIIAHNPSRGLDIPSTELLYQKIIGARNGEAAILLISEDLDELLLLSDRIAVMYKGEILGAMERNKFDRYRIGSMMGGVKEA
jgi:simple sugar transport system ATP-binding protein